MKVKFKNTEVDIWKLRKGTVLKYDWHYYHISKFGAFAEDFEGMKLIISDVDGKITVDALDCVWLEPH